MQEAESIPILLVGLKDFSPESIDARAELLRALDKLAGQCAGTLFPGAPKPLDHLSPHSVGDGFYLFFDNVRPAAALRFALDLKEAVARHQRDHGWDLKLRLRMVLGHGQPQLVGGHVLGEALIDIARVIDNAELRARLTTTDEAVAFAMSALFHAQFRGKSRGRRGPGIPKSLWA
ncbi:MAG: hypothetical protein FJX52_06255 [Alphaproteobacteria bacterium]|nr:hypothetical protein [Alphaproteobacteria bacterium]